ncbi:MAG: transketolase [Lachnospirales bacterium]
MESLKELQIKAYDLRKIVLDMIVRAKGGHIGGDFSVMEILTVLYNRHMNISPENKDDPNRDLFVMSKGHSVEAYYAVLADKGFFNKDKLIEEFSTFGTQFIGHPNNKLDGIEMNSGSLGHGLPVCVGMALASKMDKKDNRVYTVMGDGELAEGSVWEGFMSGGHYKLDNLCAVIDRNKLQISGPTEDVMSHENLFNRVKSFNWHVIEVKGNHVGELDKAFTEAKNTKGMPTCIIANTTKGYGGGSVMENKANWHHKVPTTEEYNTIVDEINARKEILLNE